MSARRAVIAFVALIAVLAATVGIVAWLLTRSIAQADPTAWMDERWDQTSSQLVSALEEIEGVESVEQTAFSAAPEFDVVLAEDADEADVASRVEALCWSWSREYPHYVHPGPIEPVCTLLPRDRSTS